MADVDKKDAASPVQIVGRDESQIADVELISGKRRVLTDALVTVEQLFGADPFADTWFRIENAGANGDTVRVQIAATANDPSTPDRDAAAVDVTINVTASEAGDEIALRDKIITELNADSNFLASLEASAVKDNAIVHITSIYRGEFWERPNVGDVSVSVTGTVSVTLGFDTLELRGKPNELARSPDDPRQGVLGISGSVITLAQSINGYAPQYLKNGSSSDMTVDGSSTPVEFKIDADSTKDYVITDWLILAQDGNITMARFMDTILTNGFLVTIVSDGTTTTFDPIITTADLLSLFTTVGGFEPIIANKAARFYFNPANPFVLKAGTSDKVSITVRDNVSGLVYLVSSVSGYLKE